MDFVKASKKCFRIHITLNTFGVQREGYSTPGYVSLTRGYAH